MLDLTHAPPRPEWLQLAATLMTLLFFSAARRAEQLFQRTQDIDRERLSTLERSLEVVPLRSRLEGLGLQHDQAVQASSGARHSANALLWLNGAVCAAATLAWLDARPLTSWTWFGVGWCLGLAAMSGILWAGVLRAARTAREATAHASRHEFLFVSSMKKRTR